MRVDRREISGFTLIELCVVIGILLILVGLALPMVGGAMQKGRQSRSMESVRQCGVLVTQYCQEQRDVYPVVEATTQNEAAARWGEAMITAGMVKTLRELDPDGTDRYGRMNIMLSKCFISDLEQSRRGQCPPEDRRTIAPVRSAMVTFPASKGALRTIQTQTEGPTSYWCCVDGVAPGPVAFADGSVLLTTWRMMLLDGVLYTENGWGYPVTESWDAYQGRDRH